MLQTLSYTQAVRPFFTGASFWQTFACVVLYFLAGISVLAETPITIHETERTEFNLGSNPEFIISLGEETLFVADDGTHGPEIWKTDGTTTGTILVKDISPGPSGSMSSGFRAFNDLVFFQADDGASGVELWKTDGTGEGTMRVKDISPGEGSSNPSGLVVMNGGLFFYADDGSRGSELWTSDGTAEGTVLLKDVYPGAEGSFPAELVTVGDVLYFHAEDDLHGRELWKSDGTEQGTVMLKDLHSEGGSFPSELTSVNDLLLFHADDGIYGRELWKTDGTEAGTEMIADIFPNEKGSFPTNLVGVNSVLFFRANDGVSGMELWRSDGTGDGTALVQDIRTGSGHSLPHNLVNFNGMLFFSASDGTSGFELWKSDGTEAGTLLVKDIQPGDGSSFPAELVEVSGVLFLRADDGVHGAELWKSDGTLPGTVLVQDVYPGSSEPQRLASHDNVLYFRARSGMIGFELWESDGTEAGTQLVKDINRTPDSRLLPAPSHPVEMNGAIYFTASDPSHGHELWKYSETAAEPVLLKDINPDVLDSNPSNLVNAGGTLFFVAGDQLHGRELWRSDGTEEGTALLKDIVPGSSSSVIRELTDVDGILFFVARDSEHGEELWMSDGSEEGTVLVKDIKGGPVWSDPESLIEVGGILFFTAADSHGRELWRSDGSSDGTYRVKDIYPGYESAFSHSYVQSLFDLNGTLFFAATDGVHGRELWRSDGREDGTVLVKDIVSFFSSNGSDPTQLVDLEGTLFFIADGEIWKSDGTEAGTTWVASPTDPSSLIRSGANLFFTAETDTHGRELWKSDGTTEGTAMVTDIQVGPGSALKEYFSGSSSADYHFPVNVNGVLYFSADDGIHGHELWRSDGTPEGTVLVKDLTGDSSAADPSLLTLANGRLLFHAVNGDGNPALFSLPLPDPPEIQAGLESQFAESGEGISLQVDVKGEGLLYRWFHDGDLIPGATDPTLLIEPVEAASGGEYKLLVSNSGGAVEMAMRLTVDPVRPQVTQVSVSDGSEFHLKFSSVPGSIYQIQVSEDLASWETVEEIAIESGIFEVEFVDTAAGETGQRFYRVVLLP